MMRQPLVLFGAVPGTMPLISRFEELIYDVAANEISDVIPALDRVQSAVNDGYYAAGFISYEASTALDESLPAKESPRFPFLWFGIFRTRRWMPVSEFLASAKPSSYRLSDWRQSISRERYRESVEAIRDYISAGDIYQANFTFREHCSFAGEVKSFFLDLCRAQLTPYTAFLELNEIAVLSVSPELFFSLKDGRLTVRPMKGTARRGKRPAEDRELAGMLRANEKERAENLMIVDLLRNDLGRISENGSVMVDSLFDVEALSTVHQMTSTVSSTLRSDVGLTELFRALFPCGSITGAPKKRSMEIIAELEDSPRGLYTGCIGYISPKMRDSLFSVAIRTAVINRDEGRCELGLGSGITWYSSVDSEFDECLLKGLFAKKNYGNKAD